MKLHEVLFAPCLSARPLFSCHRSIAHASARASVTGLLLVRHWSVAGLSLVCHWSVVGLLGSWPLVRVADRASLVHPSCIPRASLVRRSCVTRLPVPLSAGLLLVRRWPWPLLCLLLSRCSACLSVCWPVAFLSLVCLLARRCWSVADVSLVCLLVHHWLSLSCTCSGSPVYRSSICSCVCSCIVHPSLIHLFVRLLVHRSSIAHPSARASVRVRFACRWSVTPLSHESVTRLSVRSSLVCLLVQLLGSWSLPRGWSATRLSPIRRWSWPLVHLLVRRALLCPLLCPLLSCLLFCHQSVCSGHGRWLAHPLVVCCSCVIGHGRRSATHAPLVCLLVFPAARLPVALPLVRRCSACWSVCWCVAGLSVGASLVHLLVHHWSICSCITGLSATLPLVCLLVRRSSICSGHVTRASDHPSGSASLVAYSSPLVCWSFCSGHGRCFVARPSARLSLARPSARLSLARPSARLSLARLLESWSRVLPLVCLLACHSSIRSGHVTRASARVVVARASDRVVATGLLVRGWSAVRASLAMVVDLSLVHRSCVCSTRRWCVVGVLLMCN